MRTEPVVEFAGLPRPGPVRGLIDVLSAVLGKMTAYVDAAMLLEIAGYTVTNAGAGAGTALTLTRLFVDFADAGVDSIRVVLHGNNSTAGSVTVQIYDVTNSAILCTVTVTGAVATTYAGSWTTITPSGSDQELEVRVVGDGAMDPVLYTVHLQGRTTQKRV